MVDGLHFCFVEFLRCAIIGLSLDLKSIFIMVKTTVSPGTGERDNTTHRGKYKRTRREINPGTRAAGN